MEGDVDEWRTPGYGNAPAVKIEWPAKTSQHLIEVWEQLHPHLPENVTVYADSSGWQLSISWEGGPDLDRLRALLDGSHGEWSADGGTAILGSAWGTVYFRRVPHPLAAAYSVMAAEWETRCPCNGREGERTEETYDILARYEELVSKEESENLTAHPGLASSSILPEQLERMAELLVALTPEEKNFLDVRIDETYCKLGHLEGLRALEEDLSR